MGGERGKGEERGGAYGLVNMMSDAPSVHRVVRELRYQLAGSMPHVTGSSRLPVTASSHVSTSVGEL